MSKQLDPSAGWQPLPWQQGAVEPPKQAMQGKQAKQGKQGKHGKLAKIATGALVCFLVLSVLYGPDIAGVIVALAVICSAGLGLIPMIFLSWVVGAVVLDIVDAIADEMARRSEPTSP
jgi:hypothetical protein